MRHRRVASTIASMSAFAAAETSGAGGRPRVADVMTWGLVSCHPDESLQTVAALMNEACVHCVVVTDGQAGRSLWGIISDLDLVAAACVRSLADQRAGGTAMKPAMTIAPGESLELAAGLMTKQGVAHLVVVDPVERRPVGVLSTLDLAGALASA